MNELLDFHNVRFPVSISFGASGGPERCNEVVTLSSGREKRNARFAHSRRKYDVGTGIRSSDDLYEIVAFFEARRGSLHAFRFQDPFDMKSCRPDGIPSSLDQILGKGDGVRTRFSLIKTYGEGDQAYLRPISKPLEDKLLVAVAGIPTKINEVSFDNETQEIVFQSSTVPGSDQIVTAGFEFDVPVRFDTDTLSASITTFRAGQIPTIPLVEVRL